jgi:DNA-binding XRE family transcriptional regulator
MDIGNKIMLMRKEKGWSQNDLAQKAEVSREIISRYERNDVMPSLTKKTLVRMQGIESMTPDFKSHLFSIIEIIKLSNHTGPSN